MDQDYDGYDASQAEFVEPPLWPKVIGIVCISFAGLGLCCGGVGLAMAPLSAGFVEPLLEGAPPPPSMTFGIVDYLIGGIGLVLTCVLLMGGIMLVGRRPIGRTLVLLYSVPAIGVNIWSMVNTMNKQAADKQWMRDYPNNQFAQGMANNPGQDIGVFISIGLMLILGVGFPLFMFVWFAAIKTRPEQITGTEQGVY